MKCTMVLILFSLTVLNDISKLIKEGNNLPLQSTIPKVRKKVVKDCRYSSQGGVNKRKIKRMEVINMMQNLILAQ